MSANQQLETGLRFTLSSPQFYPIQDIVLHPCSGCHLNGILMASV